MKKNNSIGTVLILPVSKERKSDNHMKKIYSIKQVTKLVNRHEINVSGFTGSALFANSYLLTTKIKV